MTFFRRFLISLLFLFIFCLGALKAFVDIQLQQEFNRFAHNLKQQNNIQISTNAINLQLDGTLQLDKIHTNFANIPTPLKIETFKLGNVYRFGSAQQLPAEAHLIAQDISWQLPNTSNTNSPSVLSLLGYGSYQLSERELNALGFDLLRGDLQITLKNQADNLMLYATLKTTQLGNLEIQLKLLNVPPLNTWKPEAATELANKIQVAEFNLKYQQTETFSRLLNFIAQRTGADKQQLRQNLLTQLNNDLNRLHVPLSNELIIQLTRLFNQAGSITFNFKPTTPINLNRLFSTPLNANDLKITE